MSDEMNRLIREGARRGPVDGTVADGTQLAAALRELEAATAASDELRIDHAQHVFDRELEQARANAPRPHVPDFDAGARPPIVEPQSASGQMNDLLRSDHLGVDPSQLPQRSP